MWDNFRCSWLTQREPIALRQPRLPSAGRLHVLASCKIAEDCWKVCLGCLCCQLSKFIVFFYETAIYIIYDYLLFINRWHSRPNLHKLSIYIWLQLSMYKSTKMHLPTYRPMNCDHQWAWEETRIRRSPHHQRMDPHP